MLTPKDRACPNCGRRFTPWRKKSYCSERCRKAAENRRLRGDETAEATLVHGGENPSLQAIEKTDDFSALRGYEWVAVNEVTHKLVKLGADAIGFAMYVERQRAWFGRVGEDMSFGPTTLGRARQVVEAFLGGQDFTKREGERSWRGDCVSLV